MRKFAPVFLAFVVACSLAGSARADKDSTCEAYALSVMGQIKQSENHEECRERGFFKGDRWRNDFKYHYNACAERYDAATDRHRAFTQNEKEARNRDLSKCIDKEEHGKGKDKKDDKPELTECTIQQPGGGGGCKGGFKRVCEKMKSGKKCCGCVPDESAQTPAGERIEDHPCFTYCSTTKCGGATKEVRDACVLGCLASTNCTPR